MAKNSVRDFDATAANNTDIQSVNIAEGCAPSGINNAIRELMADIKDVSAGTVALESPQADSLTVTGDLTVDTNTLFVDASADAVGIGTTSPARPLSVERDASSSIISTFKSANTQGAISLRGSATTSDTAVRFAAEGNELLSFAGGAERMRVKSDGTLLISQTANDSGVAGHIFNTNGSAFHVRDSGICFVLNRLTNDGAVQVFRKDGTTVGSINSRSGLVTSVVLDPRSNGHGLSGSSTGVLPCDENGDLEDNAMDIGNSSNRFDDIFATNTTIQTSDQNEKQQIASLTDAEITAAKAISKLFKTFKWNDAVAAKGDNARIHAGHVAQEVQSAMTDAGLDATKYAFWCSDTWWETQTEVPAVEAVAAVTETQTDEDGNEIEVVVTPAIEAKDAYSRRDVYDTADEAPEGATQHTRLGIRYPQLLAFIGAATEQRLTSIEARLTALEA